MATTTTSTSHAHGPIEVPNTTLTGWAFGKLVLWFGFLYFCFTFLLKNTYYKEWDFYYWGFVVLLVVAAFTDKTYTHVVDELFAETITDGIFKTRRVVFQGKNGKAPWERPGKRVDLQAELQEVPKETWTTEQGAQMDVELVIMLQAEPTEEGILAYTSKEPAAIMTEAKLVYVSMFSDHFGKSINPILLLRKAAVDKEVLEDPQNRDKIRRFKKEYGVRATAGLQDVDFDPATQKTRSTVMQAVSMGQAFTVLRAAGYTEEEATKGSKMLAIPGVQEYIISLMSHGLENLREFNMVTPGGLPGTKGGKK